MISAGVTIHEPAVVFTDLGLALLGAWFAWRLASAEPAGPLGRAPAALMAGLASAAFWGAVFHAFFPEDTATLAGFIAWIPVTLSIVVAAAMLLEMGLRVLAAGLRATLRRAIVAVYAGSFALAVLLVDESFTTIVRFYVPALALFLVAATVRAIRRGGGWTLVALGLALSACAAVLQQMEVALHPVYFDHNAVYHVVQAAALVVLYLGFKGVANPSSSRAERRIGLPYE
ncbi:MAG: DUF6962 family protein [Gemmatimonadales bacterium]